MGLDNVAGPNDCHEMSNPTNSTFYATGVPMAFGQTGSRSFAVNQLNTIWQEDDAVAPAEPFGPPATPVR